MKSVRLAQLFIFLVMLIAAVPLMAQTGQSSNRPAGLTDEQWRQLQQFQMQRSGGNQQTQGVQGGLSNVPESYDPSDFVGTFNNTRLSQELARREISREELRAALARKGILLENIQEQNLGRYRDVIMQTLYEIEFSKNQDIDQKQRALETLLQDLQPEFRLPASIRTVTEQDMRMRLLEKGIIYENITPELFPRYERIITETLQELQAELDAEKREAELSKIYGQHIFQDNLLEIYRLTEGSNASETYVLGPNDVVRVTIFGESQIDLALEINDAGYIQPNDMPQVYLGGVTLADAKRLLRQRFDPYFKFRQDQFVVTVQETRPISVSVLGEAIRPGTYYLSAMNSAFNLLSVAGGPSEIGTVRQIQHIRAGKTTTLDVYKLMSNPSAEYKFNLLNNDVINVPVAQTIVRIEGAVRRPMRYEMLDTESLIDLIGHAGGLSDTAYPDFVQIRRYSNGEIILLEFNLAKIMSGEEEVPLKSGDLILVRSSRNNLFNKVSVSGSVSYPGDFGFKEDMKVSDALVLAGGLLPNSFERGYIERRSIADTTVASYIPVNYGSQSGLDTPLEPNDNILIYDRTSFSNIGDLFITGAVKQTQRLTYDPTLTIKDLMITAGGFAVGAAQNRVEVFRTNIYPDRPLSMELITLELDDNYNVILPESGFVLKPYDNVVVRQTPGFQLNRTVEINGEIEYPGVYPLESRQVHLSDIISEAGGLRSQADPIGSTVFRTLGERGYIITNLRDVMANNRNEAYDPILFEGDVITIARRENIVSILPTATRMNMAVDQTLISRGINLTFQGEKSAKWYIQNYAGGFDENADKSSVTVTLKNGQVLSTKRFLWFRRYPKVQSGSTIQIAMKPEKLQEDSGFDYDQFLSRTAQTTTSLITILLLIQQLNSN